MTNATVLEAEIDRIRISDRRLVDNQGEHRYELWIGEKRAATLDYSALPEVTVLIHSDVDPAFQGKGVGSRFVHDVLADLRSRGLKVVPRCAFVRSYLSRHPDEADILTEHSVEA